MKIRYIFNPEHDLCLANGSPHYLPPASALKFRADCHRQVEQWLEGIMGEAPLAAPSRNTDMIVPWGWNSVLVKQLRQEGVPEHLLPNEEYLNLIREYSRREHAVKCAEYLNRCNIQQNAPAPAMAKSSSGACNSAMAKSGFGQCYPSVAESSSGQCYPLPIVANIIGKTISVTSQIESCHPPLKTKTVFLFAHIKSLQSVFDHQLKALSLCPEDSYASGSSIRSACPLHHSA